MPDSILSKVNGKYMTTVLFLTAEELQELKDQAVGQKLIVLGVDKIFILIESGLTVIVAVADLTKENIIYEVKIYV